MTEKYFEKFPLIEYANSQVVDITFQAMRPFFDYMSEILTTDLNGEPILTT